MINDEGNIANVNRFMQLREIHKYGKSNKMKMQIVLNFDILSLYIETIRVPFHLHSANAAVTMSTARSATA